MEKNISIGSTPVSQNIPETAQQQSQLNSQSQPYNQSQAYTQTSYTSLSTQTQSITITLENDIETFVSADQHLATLYSRST